MAGGVKGQNPPKKNPVCTTGTRYPVFFDMDMFLGQGVVENLINAFLSLKTIKRNRSHTTLSNLIQTYFSEYNARLSQMNDSVMLDTKSWIANILESNTGARSVHFRRIIVYFTYTLLFDMKKPRNKELVK